jgi:RNA polymerase sigma-70 factor (ECF subfamily)
MAQNDPTFPPAQTATRPSIFLRLKQSDPAPREVAWRQFYDRYAPVIFGYARRKSASAQQAEEIVQNVIGGFFEASPRFVYDAARGRFRGYLKSCVGHALARMRMSVAHNDPVPVDELPVPSERINEPEELWEHLWQQQLLRRAVEIARQHYDRKGKMETFLAFEQNVLNGKPAADVAEALGLSVASVHTAKARVTQKLREIRATLEDEEG